MYKQYFVKQFPFSKIYKYCSAQRLCVLEYSVFFFLWATVCACVRVSENKRKRGQVGQTEDE